MIRTFLAVEAPPELRRALAGLQQETKRRLERNLDRADRQVRIGWVPPDSMHVTLQFLGDIAEDMVELLRRALQASLAEHGPMVLPLSRLGVFPRSDAPRVLWIGPPAGWEQEPAAQQLMTLQRAVTAASRTVGLPSDDRPFSPHLTLARIKAGERQVGLALTQQGLLDSPVTIGSLAIEAVALMHSDPQPSGPIYTKLWDVRIAACGARHLVS